MKLKKRKIKYAAVLVVLPTLVVYRFTKENNG